MNTHSWGNNVPLDFLTFIRDGSKFLVAGHKEPDGDCAWSQLAVSSLLRRLGKEVVPCSAGPFKRPEVKPYESYFTSSPSASGDPRSGDLRLIVVDCAYQDRIGDLYPLVQGLPTAIIDHHLPNDCPPWSGNGPRYVDTHAPATSFLVLNLIFALGMKPSKEEAELLFLGLCTDTGFFRHVDSTGAATFEAASILIDAGANPKAAFAAINGGKSLDSRKLLAHVLSRAECFYDGKLVISSEELDETKRFGLEGRDSDSLYQLLQSVEGVEAIVVIRQESPTNCTVGLRSRDQVDVRSIAAAFGGGGHKNAAGLSIAGTIAELTPRFIKAFEVVFTSK